MNPQEVFCLNPQCCARGEMGKGNIGVHSRLKRQYMCHSCGKPFSHRKGTPFYRAHTDAHTITLVLSLVANGCPIEAITAAFGFQPRTVRGWIDKAGAHCEGVHNELVVQPRELGQVQADEIRAKTQGGRNGSGVIWMAMALMVTTRLWLGGMCSPSRDKKLIEQVVGFIYKCALPSPMLPLLIAVDGLASYVGAVQRAFRTPQPTGHRGGPRLMPWPGVVIGQVVKQYVYVYEGGKRVGLEVSRRLAQGTQEQLEALIETTQGWGVLNTAYIERLNATFRARIAALGRRTRNLGRTVDAMHSAMYLAGTIYNFCSYHQSLLSERGVKRTPAMAAGITDHRWSLWQLLWHRVPGQVVLTPTAHPPTPQLRLLSRPLRPQQELAA